MKAIRVQQFGGPEVMQLKNVPEPSPGPTQVLVHIRAIGINPVETYLRSGSNPNLPLPYTPGTDAAGEVAALGALVRHLKPGARVYTSGSVTGTYSTVAICEAVDVHLLPEKISFAEGAALNIPFATAYRALFQRARAVPGETVLIHGASGGVGTAAIQLARAAGLIRRSNHTTRHEKKPRPARYVRPRSSRWTHDLVVLRGALPDQTQLHRPSGSPRALAASRT